jgi:hypothetical protein
MAKFANRRRRELQLKVGDQVWLSTAHLRMPTSVSRKLAPKFTGPYRVTELVTPVSVRLDLGSDSIHNVFHVSQVKQHVAGSAS